MQGSKPTIPRRDDRAEPDDDDDSLGSARIDVVSVDSVRGDNASSGMVALRRELAKLNAQAAAVEKSLDDQRRERSESLERLEKERLHAVALETRVATAEAETVAVRRAHELAVAEMRAAHETSLAELRKAREEVSHAKEEHARDRATARERIDVLERGAEEASALTERAQSELEAARQHEERLARQLEAALGRAAEAESQALTISLSHASLEGSLRTLHDEVTEAFARVGTQAAAAAAVSSTSYDRETPSVPEG